MNNVHSQWSKSGVLDEIQKKKIVFCEPKNAQEYQIIINRYYSEIFDDEDGGAILMGVCRGRISEGLDF